MGLSSMTGFARVQGDSTEAGQAWVWEVRSVNGKGLDARLRLPAGVEGVEGAAREAIARRFARGNVSATLQLRQEAAQGPRPTINETLLGHLMDRARALPEHVAPPTFDGLLQVRGVLEMAEPVLDEAAVAARDSAVLTSLEAALDALAAARDDEGRRLATILAGHLATIETLTEAAGRTAAGRPQAVAERLRVQVAGLLDGTPLSEDRLAQEIALIAAKIDIREELDRLTAHVAQARDLLAAGGPCGRRLDFLCQEFNREANTLCSKSQDVDLTRIGLDLKAVIDQVREQVQNVE
jgi:uncharacterized protein (TIGR00255 family)